MLYRLERKGLVEGKWVEKAGERRKRFYKLTPAGRKSLAEQRKSWREFVQRLEPAHGVQPCLTGARLVRERLPALHVGRSGRTILSRNWRCNWNRPTRTRLPAARARRRRCAARWHRWATGTGWGAASMSTNGAPDSPPAGMHDLRYALRFFRRNPAFTAIAAVTLAFGIGGNTAIFTMVDALALRGLPYPAPERLMAIETRKAQQPEIEPWTSALDFFDIREQSRSFSSMAAHQPGLECRDDGTRPDGATGRALRFGGILPHARRERRTGPHLLAGGRPQDAGLECGACCRTVSGSGDSAEAATRWDRA